MQHQRRGECAQAKSDTYVVYIVRSVGTPVPVRKRGGGFDTSQPQPPLYWEEVPLWFIGILDHSLEVHL